MNNNKSDKFAPEINLQPEQVIRSESKYHGRVVSLMVDTVEMPGGRIVEREVVAHPGAVAVVAVNKEGDIVLIRQYRHPAGKVLWEIPAGKLEPEEDPKDCAIREMAEETGYIPTTLQKINQFYTAPGFASEIIHLFFGEHLQPVRAQMDEDEAIAVYMVPLTECLCMIADGRIEDGKTIVGILMLKEQQQKQILE